MNISEIFYSFFYIFILYFQFATVVGILIANLLGKPWGYSDPGWRWLVSVTVIPSLLQLCCWPFLLESPRWMISRDRETAHQILINLRGVTDPELIGFQSIITLLIFTIPGMNWIFTPPRILVEFVFRATHL